MHTCGMSMHACVTVQCATGLPASLESRCACGVVGVCACLDVRAGRGEGLCLELSNTHPLNQPPVSALCCSRRTPGECRAAAGEAAKLLRPLAQNGRDRVGLKHPLCVMSNACLCGCLGLPCICTPTQTSRLSPRSPAPAVPCCCVSSPSFLFCRLQNCIWRSLVRPCWVTTHRVTRQGTAV
ncbi:hypothetical protein COO60DRAFT_15538 [Scenedesmus sp. NREL 46B-D3]|nr:hypothetical protein COO60DRAFT_15538 [Scenedesmus sp. NREL 46B-D3]